MPKGLEVVVLAPFMNSPNILHWLHSSYPGWGSLKMPQTDRTSCPRLPPIPLIVYGRWCTYCYCDTVNVNKLFSLFRPISFCFDTLWRFPLSKHVIVTLFTEKKKKEHPFPSPCDAEVGGRLNHKWYIVYTSVLSLRVLS